MKNIIGISIILFFCSFTLSAQDIQSNTSGFSASAGVSFSSWGSESSFMEGLANDEPSGFGYFLGFAYGFNQHLGVRYNHYGLNFSKNYDWNRYRTSQNDVLFRYTFGATLARWRPFLQTGLSFVSNTIDPVSIDGIGEYELRSSGVAFDFGGGVDFFLLDKLAIGIVGDYKFGSYGVLKLDDESIDANETVDFNFFNINIGLTYLLWSK